MHLKAIPKSAAEPRFFNWPDILLTASLQWRFFFGPFLG